MKKRISLLLIAFSIFICGVNQGTVCANTNDKPKPIEEAFPEFGYTTAEEAIKKFEQYFNRDLKLPLRIPPINFTHYMGRFSNSDGNINDSLELKFINEESPENHYKIDVRPIKYKIELPDKYVVKKTNLESGNEAIFMQFSSGWYGLVFERDNWQYILSIDGRVSEKVNVEELVKIANSIVYSSEENDEILNLLNEIKKELIVSIAKQTGLEKESIAILVGTSSVEGNIDIDVSIVLPKDAKIDDTTIQQIVENIIRIVSKKESVTISEENIEITTC